MKIRTAITSDMECLLDIFNYEVTHSTATFAVNTQTLEERMSWFEAHNCDNHPLIVAEEEDRAVGYASLSEFRSSEAYKKTVELSVYIDHRYRGRGIGEALMMAIIDMARQDEGIHSLVSVITAGNEASIALHKKLGFVYCGSLKAVGEKFGTWLDTENYQLLV